MKNRIGTVTAICTRSSAVIIAAIATCAFAAKTIRVDDLLPEPGMTKTTASAVARAVHTAATQLEPGDALVLPFNYSLGDINLPPLPSNVQLIGGKNGTLTFSGPIHKALFFGQTNVDFSTAAPLRKTSDVAVSLEGSFFINSAGAIDITSQVSETYWISHTIPHGRRGKIDAAMTNCTFVWLRHHSDSKKSPGDPVLHFKLHNTGQNVKLLQLIEHNQNSAICGLKLEDVVGMQLANGATEGCNVQGPTGVYELKNCRGVHLAQREFFDNHREGSSWGGEPTMTLLINGGEGNILDHINGMADPKSVSMLCTDPKIQIWSSNFEDRVTLPQNPQGVWLSFFSPECMTLEQNTWTEPRLAHKEVVCAYEDASGRHDLTAGNPDNLPIPAPASMPVCDIPETPELLYKKAAGFGQAALAAGADPTGRRPSDAIFSKLIEEDNLLEIPAGTFRLDNPIVIDPEKLSSSGVYGGKRVWIAAAGKDRTRIIAPPGQPAFIAGSRGPAKAGASNRSKADILITEPEIVGGSYGYEIGNQINVVLYNVRFRDQTEAGVSIFSNTIGGNAEQNRLISCEFINTGDYGVRTDKYQDKNLYFRCRFEGQRKGGIYATNPTKWHSGVYQCTFKNIGGPGVAIIGGNPDYGYESWVFTVDSCQFLECGSATEPVVDFGISRLSVLSNSVIRTTGKQVYAGFSGTFAVIDNVHFDCDFKDGVGLYLGNQRFTKTGGIAGSRLKDVTVNGDLAWLDYESYVTGPYYVANHYADTPWRFGYVFYNVESNNYQVDYGLVNNGRVTVLEGSSSVRAPAPLLTPAPSEAAPTLIYDIRGRLLAEKSDARAVHMRPAGVYLEKKVGRRMRTVKRIGL